MTFPDDLPARTKGSLGTVKTNRRRVSAPGSSTDADEHNEAMDTIRAICEILGTGWDLGDGTALARLAAVEGGGSSLPVTIVADGAQLVPGTSLADLSGGPVNLILPKASNSLQRIVNIVSIGADVLTLSPSPDAASTVIMSGNTGAALGTFQLPGCADVDGPKGWTLTGCDVDGAGADYWFLDTWQPAARIDAIATAAQTTLLDLDVTSLAQLSGGGAVNTAYQVRALQARVDTSGGYSTPSAGDFDVTVDGDGPYTITMLGTETYPLLAVNRINARWQALSGQSTRIAYLTGASWSSLFLASPTAGPSSSIDLTDGTGSPLADMGFGAAPYSEVGASLVPTVFGSFPRRNITNSSITIAASDQFTATVDGVGPHTLTLTGGTYANPAQYQLLCDDINAQWQAATSTSDKIAWLDASNQPFISAATPGSGGSMTLTDGTGTPLADMGVTTGTIAGVDDTPAISVMSAPIGPNYPVGSSPISALRFHTEGMGAGCAKFYLSDLVPLQKMRIAFDVNVAYCTGSVPGRAVAGIAFAGDASRNSDIDAVVPTVGASFVWSMYLDQQLVGACGGTGVYAARCEIEILPSGGGAVTTDPVPGLPAFMARMRATGSPGVEVGGMALVDGGPFSHYTVNGGGWMLSSTPPDTDRIALVFYSSGPSYGPVDLYVTGLRIEAMP